MEEQLFIQFNRRIDEHYETLCNRIDGLAEVLRVLNETQVQRLEAHEAYHRQFEHRWGLIKLAGRYPFRLAALAFAAAWTATAATPESRRLLEQFMRSLMQWFQ